MKEPLKLLQEWYAAQCDGQWEHQWGIKINTLDNPGWAVSINLLGTTAADTQFPELRIDKSPTDWIQCWKREGQFCGRGDPSKLEAILEYFFDVVSKEQAG